MFAAEAASLQLLPRAVRVEVALYGSLALTGKGHATDRAVLLGLEGWLPDGIDPEFAQTRVEQIRAERRLRLGNAREIAFDETRDLQWHFKDVLSRHPNGMRIAAFSAQGAPLLERTYYSVGGGFVETEGAHNGAQGAQAHLPHAFGSAEELLAIAACEKKSIWEIVRANELALRDGDEVNAYLDRIWDVMQKCAQRGLRTEGILPGGLNVRRRAPRLYARYLERANTGGMEAMDYVNVVAMAVNEENAAGGRVVTAPTNGAAGVIPAVLHHYMRSCHGTRSGVWRFLMTAAAIGSLYKNNASISGAEVGCQGEVGVACSMAAGGLVAAMNGSASEVEHAAEIGMEHSLGMTCDTIGGLVQIPCIERNAVGAVRAIQAARMATEHEGDHRISLDRVIEVMYRTGMDMQNAYKETSLGGLAVVEC